MWRCCRVLIVTTLTAAACSRAPAARDYQVRGQILGIDRDRREVLVDHEDIKGFMPAMTMPYTVRDVALLDGKTPGDLVTATLVVEEVNAYLSAITTTGHAPVKAQGAGPLITDADLLKEGDPVPDRALINQHGAAVSLPSLRGHRVALTFIYTRCPLPDFCPLMDKRFTAVQSEIRKSPDLADVRLISVTVDPDFDTPAVLSAHAKTIAADPRLWQFATGTQDDVRAFARGFGVVAELDDTGAALVHNLRTAVIDAQGRLVTVYSGSTWTPAELVADLKKASSSPH